MNHLLGRGGGVVGGGAACVDLSDLIFIFNFCDTLAHQEV